MTELQFNNVGISLSGTEIVREFSFSLKDGEFVALLGPNGAGKTTVMKAAVGLVDYTGQILLRNKQLSDISQNRLGQELSYIPQGHDVHWPMTVRDIVSLGRLPHKPMTSNERVRDKDAVDLALTITDLTSFASRRFDQLSGGEKSRVMIARALATQAPLMLADEPTAALDPYNQLQILELLKEHVKKGASVIAVMHDILLAGQFADRVILMDDGRCIEHGMAKDVLTADNLKKVYGIERIQDIVIEQGMWKRIIL